MASVISIREIPETLIRETYLRSLKHRINLYFSHEDPESLPAMNICTRWMEPFILVSGDVIADCAILMQGRREFLKKISLGNVFQKSFREIWSSALYRLLRETVVNTKGRAPICCVDCCAFNTKIRAQRYGIWDYTTDKVS
jgi:MoaA/NifB/PqqE/SkfB family radical SAM enzyme